MNGLWYAVTSCRLLLQAVQYVDRFIYSNIPVLSHPANCLLYRGKLGQFAPLFFTHVFFWGKDSRLIVGGVSHTLASSRRQEWATKHQCSYPPTWTQLRWVTANTYIILTENTKGEIVYHSCLCVMLIQFHVTNAFRKAINSKMMQVLKFPRRHHANNPPIVYKPRAHKQKPTGGNPSLAPHLLPCAFYSCVI